MESAAGGMESTRSVVWHQADEPYAHSHDAIRDCVAIPCNAQSALIPYQASFVGLDKKRSNPKVASFFGAATRIRTGDLILTKDVLYQLSHSSVDG